MAGLTRTRKPIFSLEWVDAVKGTPEAAMSAERVEIFSFSGTPVLDEETNTYVTAKVVHYDGKARIQPLRSARAVWTPGNDTTSQTVQFQFPIDEGRLLDLRPAMQVRVREASLSPTLVNYVYTINEVIDSSNAIERTFVCEVNLEQVAA